MSASCYSVSVVVVVVGCAIASPLQLMDGSPTTPLQDGPPTTQVPIMPENRVVFPELLPTDASNPTFPATTLLPDATLAPAANVSTNNSEENYDCVRIRFYKEDFVELLNGTIHVPRYGRTYSPEDYIKDGDTRLVCYEEETTEKFSPIMGLVSKSCMGLSSLCLLLHLAAFALVPELRNHSGRNLASLCLALLAAYITLLANVVADPEGAGCVAVAAAMYYFFLTSFTWMNVIAFDVWYTFCLTQRQLRVSNGAQWHRFIAYSLYSWLLPGAATVAFVVVDQLKPSGIPEDLLPGIGETWCWFYHRKALLAFFAAPMMILIVMNFVFFVSTAVIITQAGSTVPASSTRDNNPRRQYTLYVRLAVLMGFTWVSGIVAGYLNVEALWYVYILLNTLQGVFIFLAFTFRTKVWQGMGASLTKMLRRGVSIMTRRPPPADIRDFEMNGTPETTLSYSSPPVSSMEAR